MRGNSLDAEYATAKRWSLRVRLFPIIFFITYLNITVFLFAFGPWPYPVKDGTKLYLFLAFAHLALLVGYMSAAFGKPRDYYGRWSVQRLVTISLIVNLLLFFPTSKFLTGNLVPNIIKAFSNLGAVYGESRFLRQENIPSIMYLRMLLAPITVILLPLTAYYWKKLRPSIRKWAAIIVLGDAAIFLAIGTNAGVARLILIGSWLIVTSRLSEKGELKRFRSKLRILVFGVTAFFLIFLFFTGTMLGRKSSLQRNYFPAIGIHANTNNFLVRYLPPEMQVGMLGLSLYVTHGYYALYLALDEPFVPMFGVGHSLFLFRQASRITGIREIMDLPYPVRIEKYGWDAYGLWSTIYPWIASDMSFPGTILIIFLIGRLFALSWLDTLRGDNIFAVVVFSQLLMILFFFPGTNQWLQGGEGLVAFWVTLLIWLFTRKKYPLGSRRLFK